MNYLKRLTAVTVFLLSCTYFCYAAVPKEWVQIKTIAFKNALDEDKYILLFVGMTGCLNCNNTTDSLTNPALPLKQILDDNYIVWWSDDNNPLRRAENEVYSAAIKAEGNAHPNTVAFPLIFIINPAEPDISINSLWSSARWNIRGYRGVDSLKNFLTIDLTAGSSLKWYKNEDEVFQLAQQQRKFIFKLDGRGTSEACKKVLKQLEINPLSKLLQDNYILWYSEYNSSALTGVEPLQGEDDNLPVIAPYISIIYPGAPDQIVDAIWGYQDVETLEDFLKSNTVSNEFVASANKVTVTGNYIQISNRIRNEQIRVFTLTGQQIASIGKNDYTVTIDASNFPEGVLIVSGSSGWSSKILVR